MSDVENCQLPSKCKWDNRKLAYVKWRKKDSVVASINILLYHLLPLVLVLLTLFFLILFSLFDIYLLLHSSALNLACSIICVSFSSTIAASTSTKKMMFLLLIVLVHLLLTQGISIPLFTIQSADGDIIDCIHMREQPAFKHPLLRNHKIQTAPKGLLPNMINKMDEKRVSQVWNRNGASCPDQTVPIRRSTVGANQVSKKHWNVPYPAEEGHEYAIGETGYLRGIYGTVATMNLWDPTVEQGTREFSLSQIWLVAGEYNGSNLNTIEAGWQVFPDHYHDNQPRLFIYWTNDTYEKTGCLNLECPGFVQVTSDFTIGGAFSPISSYGGDQFDIKMSIFKDMDGGNWWLGIGQSFIGYWPAKLFTHLAVGPAKLVQWGGEIVNTRNYGQHTTTQMGSGHFAEEGFGKASFFRNLRIINYLYHLQPVQEFFLQTLNTTCYNAQKGFNEEWGAHFYYGGPGYNALCP